ncbi:serine hydrolase domain-containing protein [Fluviicola sp.]|uniref:serine hydrolase domain-containing protein n=1 Tax=Fluviicola sp. TaxID=1917219 RepID=UPI0031DF9432
MKQKLLVCLMLLSGQTFAQLSAQKTRLLDSLFNQLNENQMSMGSISIFKDGKEVYAKCYGISNKKNGTDIPASKEKTHYRIGSISKVFTAFLIMKSVESGKLSLKQPIVEFFPDLNGASTVTIEQLLVHKNKLPIFHRVDDLEELRKSKTESELIATVNKGKPNPDSLKTVYNNLNYILLGLIVEKVNGAGYNEVLKNSLNSLEQKEVYGTFHLLDYQKNEANSFHISNENWVEDYEIRECPIADGSGFLLSNPQTLNTFMYALFNGKLLSEESLKQMLPAGSMFGYGLMKANFDEHKGFGHTGRIEGFTSAATYFTEDKINVALLQNGTVYPMNDILILVGDILFDKQVEIPNFKKVTLSTAETAALLGTYENAEEGYKVIADLSKGQLRIRVAKGNGFMNKMILETYALSPSRIFNPSQGIIFDFIKRNNGTYSECEMRVNGSKLPLKKISE